MSVDPRALVVDVVDSATGPMLVVGRPRRPEPGLRPPRSRFGCHLRTLGDATFTGLVDVSPGYWRALADHAAWTERS